MWYHTPYYITEKTGRLDKRVNEYQKRQHQLSVNPIPKPFTASVRKRSEVIDQESLYGRRKVEGDIPIWHQRLSLNRDRDYHLPHIYNHLLSHDQSYILRSQDDTWTTVISFWQPHAWKLQKKQMNPELTFFSSYYCLQRSSMPCMPINTGQFKQQMTSVVVLLVGSVLFQQLSLSYFFSFLWQEVSVQVVTCFKWSGNKSIIW